MKEKNSYPTKGIFKRVLNEGNLEPRCKSLVKRLLSLFKDGQSGKHILQLRKPLGQRSLAGMGMELIKSDMTANKRTEKLRDTALLLTIAN